MADLPSFSEFFTDNLTEEKVDRFYAEKELETLREMCLGFNNSQPEQGVTPIEIDEISNDKIAMIIAL